MVVWPWLQCFPAAVKKFSKISQTIPQEFLMCPLCNQQEKINGEHLAVCPELNNCDDIFSKNVV